jgi:hypothetical protein
MTAVRVSTTCLTTGDDPCGYGYLISPEREEREESFQNIRIESPEKIKLRVCTLTMIENKDSCQWKIMV